jgi:predicted nucleic acid-binding protein
MRRRRGTLSPGYDDKDFSLCDAISFAVMERRSARIAFAFDSHFRQYGRFTVLGAE